MLFVIKLHHIIHYFYVSLQSEKEHTKKF